MKFKMVVLCSVLGGLLGYFILHPLFMIIGHLMLESNFIHKQSVFDIIVTQFFHSFSLKMLPWNLAFAIAGALLVNISGYIIQMQSKLRQLSYTDGLTGIANRRHFQEELDQMWRHEARVSEPISLIMCDIDYFKAYNDTYGHQKGDKCLQLLSRTLSETLKRPLDMVARYGGEEFVVILPDTTLNGASSIAEDMRDRVESLGITHDKSKIAKVVTISLGVATITPSQNSYYDALILAADQALYRAKEEGRNRVKVAPRLQ
jgi:diguanylate cyclase (GGDEF)-like protein